MYNLLDIIDSIHNLDEDILVKELDKYEISIQTYTDGKALLIANLFDKSTSNIAIKYIARGLVYDQLKNDILSIPYRSVRHLDNCKTTLVEEYMSKNYYDISLAQDGTTITLYEFEGNINIATGKSADVSQMFWNGDKTFSEMLYESIENSCPDLIKDTKMTIDNSKNIHWNIPKNYCVTLGFRHHDIHPFKEDPMDVWLYQCIDRNTNVIHSLPQLKSLSKNTKLEKISYNDMIKKCNRNQRLNRIDIFYGYILDSNNENVLNDYKKIFIPSSFYKLLMHFFYKSVGITDEQITHENRYQFNIFYNILNFNNDYISLLKENFTGFNKIIRGYIEFIDSIVVKICNTLQTNDQNTGIYKEFIDKITSRLLKNEKDINVNDISTNKVVKDYVYDTTYTLNIIKLYNNSL